MIDPGDSGNWEVQLAEGDPDLTDIQTGDRYALVDLVNRLLDKGVVTGDVTISVAGVDLDFLGLNAVLTSVATARGHLGRPVGGLE